MDLATLDKEIARHKSALLRLYSQRNRFSSIFRLPTEVLGYIFLHYARDYHEDDREPTWINVSHVCSHWRNVALRFPALWGHIDVRPGPWTDELLARSKNTLLRIRVPLGSFSYTVLLKNVMPNTHRIQELELELPDAGALPMLSVRAPHLRKLSISIEIPSDSEESLTLFEGNTPALRILDLTDCPISLYSFNLDNLTTLSIQGTDSSFPHRVEDFLGILRNMPHLDTLFFMQEIPGSQQFVSSGAFHDFQKVNLPRLSSFRMYSTLSAIIAVLGCTNIPINAELELECFYEEEANDITLLSLILGQRYSASKAVPIIRSLGIASCDLGQLRVAFYTSECNFDSLSFGPDDRDRGVPLQVTINGLDGGLGIDGGLDGIHSDMCFFMPLTHVQTVYNLKPTFSSSFWGRLLEHIPNVRSIKLSSGTMPNLASLLSFVPAAAEEENQAERKHGMLVPALERLELYEITAKCSPPEKDGRSISFLEYLEDVLRTRPGPAVQLIMNFCDLEGPKNFGFIDLTEDDDEDEDEVVGADEDLSDGSDMMVDAQMPEP